MPVYNYECGSCGHKQEVFHPMSGPTEKIKCEKCGSIKITKVISTPYVKFVGSDWDTNRNRGIQ